MSNPRVGSADGKYKWVIMYYFQGNNNISRDTIYKAARLETVGSNDQVATVVLTSEPENTPYPGVMVFKAEKREDIPDPNKPDIKSKPIYINRKEDAASPETLKNFIKMVMKRYPAKHYALIMMDHGFGYLGGMDNAKGKFMDLRDIEKVLREVKEEEGKGIDILGFDACLMAQLEVANQFKGAVKFLVASQDIEHPYGWEEHAVVRELMNRLDSEDLSPRDVALLIGEVNAKYPEAMKTVSVIDLEKVRSLVSSLDSLAEDLLKIPLEDLKAMMRRTPHMCHYFPEDKLCTNYRDLRGFLEEVRDYAKSKNLVSTRIKAEKALKALDKAVLFWANSGEEVYKGNTGLSAYLPPDGMLTKYYRTYEKKATLPLEIAYQGTSQQSIPKGVIQNPKEIWMGLRLAQEAPNWKRFMELLGEDSGGVPGGVEGD